MPPVKSTVQDRRTLPSKEAALFKELLSLYEAQQLKKAQKTADQILKKFPEHGETLAMKGLVTFQGGKKEEGLELIRKGIRFDLTSHIVWHVFGLAKKTEKDYEEAVKSYQQALRYDKDNLNILRDAANMHMQLRNFEPLEDLRLQILRLRPNVRQHWLSLAVAYHMNGHLEEALHVLETYENLVKDIPPRNIEHSQIILYHLQILEQLKENEKGLSLLETAESSNHILDVTSALEYRARLHTNLGNRREADQRWRELIDLNPDNIDYYKNFLENHGIDLDNLSPEHRASGLQHLGDFARHYTHSRTASRLALDLAGGMEFRTLARAYVIDGFRRGVPSLFVDVKSLFKDSEKHKILLDIAESIQKSSELGSFDPTITVWSMYFLAQHASFVGDQLLALSRLRWLENHTPTLPELYILKAKALKRGGDPFGASQIMDEARHLDLQDRFLNWKAAKYMLRAGRPEKAERILGLFTKKDAPSPGFDLDEMQCLAYLIEEGDAHRKARRYGSALKYYKRVEKIFVDIEDDQFDFHGYAIRKFNLEPYIDVLRWEDSVKDNFIYIHAVLEAVKIYLRPLETLQPAHRQQAPKRSKKGIGSSDVNGDTKHETDDDDPLGTKLLDIADPLKHAATMLKALEDLDTRQIEVWLVSFDVAVKRGQWLQAARALRAAHKLDPQNSDLYWRIVHLRLISAKLEPGIMRRMVKDNVAKMLSADIPIDFVNSEFLQRHPGDVRAPLAVLRVSRLSSECQQPLEHLILSVFGPGFMLDMKTAEEILEELQLCRADNITELFIQKCKECFPLSPTFTPGSLGGSRHLVADSNNHGTECGEVLF